MNVKRAEGNAPPPTDVLVRYSVLGSLTAKCGSKTVAVSGPRQRTILSMLVASWGRVVSVDGLVDAVWGERPPATARTQIAICIGALRKAFKNAGAHSGIILTEHPGYRLETECSETDLMRFTTLSAEATAAAEQGRLVEASALYRTALDLWQNRAFAGVTGRPIEDEATRLDEKRLTVYEAWAELELQLERHQSLIPELTAVTRDHPFHEQLKNYLMLAQYRSGRRAEAAEGFRVWRSHFVDELGLEPGPAITELHNAILRDDPGLMPAETKPEPQAELPFVPAELPPDTSVFIGREKETEQLNLLLADRGPLVALVTGVAGSGKTSLVVHWAHEVAKEFPDGVLYADSFANDGEGGRAAYAMAGRFLRAFGLPSDRIPVEMGERISLYRSVIADRRALFIFDSIGTMEQLRLLLPGSGRSRAVVIGREQLAVDHDVVRVTLGLMPAVEARELVRRIAGIPPSPRYDGTDPVPDDDAMRELVRLCDGLPLALRIAARRLAAKRHWSVQHLVSRLSDERRRLDELSTGGLEVRASFALTYQALSREAAAAFRLLGLLDLPDFTAWVGAALLEVPVSEAEDILEQLVDAQFLTVSGKLGAGGLRYRFHDLLRLYARERAQGEIAQDERDAAQERVFHAYLVLAGEAHRREYGGDFSIVHGSTPCDTGILPAAVVDGLLLSPLDWYEAERASLVALVTQACRLGRDELAWELVMCSVVLFETRTYYDDWRHVAELALKTCRQTGNRRGEAAMCFELGSVEMFQQRFDLAIPCFESALRLFDQVGEVHGRALTLRNMAIVDRVRGNLGAAREQLEEARAIFRSVGDVSAEAHALSQMSQIELEWHRAEEAVRLSLEAVRIANTLGETRGTAQAYHRLANAYAHRRQFAQAEEAYGLVLSMVRRKQDRRGEAHALLGLGECRLACGRLAEAENDLLVALPLAQRAADPSLLARVNLALGRCCEELGRHLRADQYRRAADHCLEHIGAAARPKHSAEMRARVPVGAVTSAGGAPSD